MRMQEAILGCRSFIWGCRKPSWVARGSYRDAGSHLRLQEGAGGPYQEGAGGPYMVLCKQTFLGVRQVGIVA